MAQDEYRVVGCGSGLLASFLALAVLTLGSLAFVAFTLYRSTTMAQQTVERAEQLFTAKQQLGECTLLLSRARGSLETYRAILINPQKNAIIIAVEEYTKLMGDLGKEGNVDLESFQKWIKGRGTR